MDIIMLASAIITGLFGLTWSAKYFVDAAVVLAYYAKVSTVVIGLTVVAFGTSAPEILVSAIAAWQGNTGLALGNAIGSNTANIALVLGMTALITPLTFRQPLSREFNLLLVVTVGVYLLLSNQQLDRWNGWILLIALAAFVIWTIKTSNTPQEITIPTTPPRLGQQIGLFIFSLVLLLLSSRLLVWGAIGLAQYFNISEEVIGLTIVAIGTSLPELATSISAARQGQHGLLIGNIVGSNLFNLLAVLGVAGVIHPIAISDNVLLIDYPLMMGLTGVLFILAYFKHLHRWHAVLLLIIYFSYLVTVL